MKQVFLSTKTLSAEQGRNYFLVLQFSIFWRTRLSRWLRLRELNRNLNLTTIFSNQNAVLQGSMEQTGGKF
jgi:hypothetical protein